MDSERLADSLIGLWRWAQQHAPAPEPEIRRRLREHLGAEPADLAVLTEDLSEYDHVNVQVALDALDAEPELIGLSVERGFPVSLAELVGAGSRYGMQIEPGPPEYTPVDVGDRTISCLNSGLLLLRSEDVPVAALLAPHRDQGIPGERPARAPRAAPARPARHGQDALRDVPRRADAGADGDPADRLREQSGRLTAALLGAERPAQAS